MKMFELREWTIPPDGMDQAPVHTHLTSDEVFYVLEGEMEFLIGTERKLLVLVRRFTSRKVQPILLPTPVNRTLGFWSS